MFGPFRLFIYSSFNLTENPTSLTRLLKQEEILHKFDACIVFNKPFVYIQMHCFPQGTSDLLAVEGANICTDLLFEWIVKTSLENTRNNFNKRITGTQDE